MLSGKLFQVGMTEKKNENLTVSTLPNFGIIFFECEALVVPKAAIEEYSRGFQASGYTLAFFCEAGDSITSILDTYSK